MTKSWSLTRSWLPGGQMGRKAGSGLAGLDKLVAYRAQNGVGKNKNHAHMVTRAFNTKTMRLRLRAWNALGYQYPIKLDGQVVG